MLTKKNITLNINEKGKDGWYPLLRAVSNNNVEIVQLLLEYANQHQIILEYKKEDIKNKPEIKELFENYEKEKEKLKQINNNIQNNLKKKKESQKRKMT